MNIITRLSKVKNLRLYAGLVVLLLVAFQSYWLFSVYDSRQNLILEEGQNMLRTAVLELDRTTVESQLKGIDDPDGVGVDPVIKQLLKVLRDSKGASIKLSVQGTDANDSVSRTMLDKLTQSKPKNQGHKAQKIYRSLEGPMRLRFGQTDFEIVYNDKSTSASYPKKYSGNFCETAEVRSEIIDANQYYTLRFYQLPTLVLEGIWPFLALSVVYLGICIGAVVFLVKNVAQARRLMQQKDNFTNSMTHEFKTPMATISAAVEALQHYGILDDREMAHEYLGMIKNDVNRLVEMTDSILLNAKMSDGKIPLAPEPVEVSEFISGVCQGLKPILDKASASVEINPPEKPLTLKVDRQHFANVFRNLIDNSIKYSDEPAQISIDISKEKDCARILFSDQGIGIPEKYRSEIFKPYFRVQENNIYTVKGFGLGLDYIRQIIELSRGTIELLAPEPGKKGTTFKILIPLHHD